MKREPAIVIGVGQRWRSDDALGWHCIKALKEAELPETRCHYVGDDMLEMVDLWHSDATVIMIDALHSSSHKPGTVLRVSREDVSRISGETTSSTHTMCLPQVLELATALGKAPKSLVVWGIVGECFEMGESLSPAVAGNVCTLITKIKDELLMKEHTNARTRRDESPYGTDC